MNFTLIEISKRFDGIIEGDQSLVIHQLVKIDDEETLEGSLSFFANPKYEKYVYDTHAKAILVPPDFKPKKKTDSTLIFVKDPYIAFGLLLQEFSKVFSDRKVGIEQPSYIDSTAQLGHSNYLGAFSYLAAKVQLGNNVQIYPNCYIGEGTKIGDNTILYPGVKIYPETKIGKNCVIHSGTVIGSEGFGFAPQQNGTYINIPQIGRVIIEDDVRIGANTTVDRATLGNTIIKKGVKLDNLIQVGHNVVVGENTVISAQTGISGSTKIGKNCMIGGQAGLANSITIADNVKIGGQSGVNSSLKEGRTVMGSFAFEYMDFMKSNIIFRKLPDLARRVDKLESELNKTHSLPD